MSAGPSPADGGATSPLIDLGDLSAAPQAARPRVRLPAMDARARRLTQFVALVVMVLLAGGAAVAPQRPRLDLVASVPVGVGGRMMVIGSRLIVIDRSAGRYRISAFSLPGGRRLWRSPMAGSGAGTSIVTTRSTVIVMMAAAGQTSSAQAFDLSDGASRWRQPSVSAVLAEGDTVFVTGAPDITGGSDLRVLDAASGAVRWTATVPPDCQTRLVNDGAPASNPGLIELCVRSQQLRVFDADTGRERAHEPLDLFPIPRGPDSADLLLASPGMEAIGDLIIVLHDNYPTATFDAYHARDLRPAWSGVAGTASSYLYPCGPDICMIGGGIVAVLDPLTGKRVPGLSPPSLGRPASIDGRDGAPTTLVVVPIGQAATAVTGGLVPDFAYPHPENTTVPVPAAADGLTWVARQVMTATGYAVEPLQLLHGIAASACVPISRYVACTTTGGTMNIWRLP